MSFCHLCSGLTLSRLYPPNIYHHAENLAGLEQSGQVCQLCKLIHWCVLKAPEYYHNITPELYFEGAVDEKNLPNEVESRNQCSIKLQIVRGSWYKRGNKTEIRHIGIWMKSKYMLADLTLTVEEGDELGTKALTVNDRDCWVANRVFASKYPSEAYFEVARRWLNDCELNHPDCYDCTPEPPELPKRVIDVGQNGQMPRLVEGAGRRSRYVTLSHCWGRSRTITTEMDSLRLREASIPLESLPKTFREAVLTCRKLEIPYLWIDSLCIIQDNKGDWEYHSSVMGSIFYNSTLTLAATDASDSCKGLFIPEAPSIEHSWLGIIALPLSFGNYRGQVYASSSSWNGYISPFRDVQSGVLQSRGWVMQERYLSPRTLHFLKGQMVWECSELGLSQSGYCQYWEKHKDPLRKQLRTFQRTFEGSYRFVDWEDEGGDDHVSDDTPNSLNHDDVHSNNNKAEVEDEGGYGHDANATPGRLEYDEVDQYSNEVEEDDAGRPREAAGAVQYNMSETSEEKKSFDGMLVATLHSPSNGRASYIVDLRDPPSQGSNTPIPVERHIDNALYDMLDVATRWTIYYIWYDAVSVYSDRRLTFAFDKLPALAGVASRVHAITKDQYLAGHWRRELERSLFWRTKMNFWDNHPGRVKEYRAPSWSWASVAASVSFDFPDLAPGADISTTIEILEASIDIDGKNPFGCVIGGKILIKANIIRATWNKDNRSWLLKGDSAAYSQTQFEDLKIVSPDSTIIGAWQYDDVLNGIMPGQLLTQGTSMEDVRSRSVALRFYRAIEHSDVNNQAYGKDLQESSTLWRRGTYVPETLVLVRGPTRVVEKDGYSGRKTTVEVLVLARSEGSEGEYRRIGVGNLGSWDAAAESVEILTVV